MINTQELNENYNLRKERLILRDLLDQAAECIAASRHGHTPDWTTLMEGIEAYEDEYQPLGDKE